MKRKSDYFVFIIFISIILTFYAVFITGQKDISEEENRELAKLQTFSMEDFTENRFQNNIEKAISDQIVISGTVKKAALETRNKIVNSMNNIILKLRNNPDSIYYAAVSEKVYKINSDDHLLNRYLTSSYDERTINYYNHIEGADKYFYFIETDCSKVYNKEEYYKDMYKEIAKKLNVKASGKFEVSDYETYKENFYKTDHHWNRKGQYKAYKEIAKLLGIPENEQVKVVEEKQYDIPFFGSRAREASEYDIEEKFTVYKYNNLKPTKTYVDGVLINYGKKEEYDKGEFETKQSTNHYGDYYGWDNGEIIFDFNKPEKENLLIISDSYSNALNEIIASSYNKTYIIDFRQNPKFEPNEYIKNNDIDKILILGDIAIFNQFFRYIDLSMFET